MKKRYHKSGQPQQNKEPRRFDDKKPRERDGKVRRHRRLAHATLAGPHRQDAIHPRHGLRSGLRRRVPPDGQRRRRRLGRGRAMRCKND